MAIWSGFQGITGVTRGRREEESKKCKIGITSFMDDPDGLFTEGNLNVPSLIPHHK